jgi:ABC-type amino acid transport system permease subunit
MTVAQQAVAYSYRYAEYYSAALLYYLAMVLVLMIVQKNIERKMSWVRN